MITKELNTVIKFIDYLTGLNDIFSANEKQVNNYVDIKIKINSIRTKGIKSKFEKQAFEKKEKELKKELFPILIEPIDDKMIEHEIYNSKEILKLNNIRDEVFRKSFENLDSNDLQVIQTKFDEYIDFKIQNIDFFNAVDPYFLDFHSLDKYVYEMLFNGEVNDRLINAFPNIQSEQPHQIEEKQEPPKTRKYTANEYALAYILELYAKGRDIPTNRVEGGLAKNEIKQIGESKYKLKGDTFYRAVKKVKEFDLNSKTHLENISKDWYNAIMQISNNDKDLKEFLIKKQLI